MRTSINRRFDFSGGIQTATTWLLRKPNEVWDIINGKFNAHIGSIARRLGYTVVNTSLETSKPGLGLYEAKFSTGATRLAAIDKADGSKTLIKSETAGTWSDLTLPGTILAGSQVRFASSLDEAYAAGISGTTRMTPLNIKKDLTVSSTRNLIGAPKCAFITEYGGALWAINVEVDGVVYQDRAYRSSQALGAITYVRGAQLGAISAIPVDSVRYLKAGMAIDIYAAGTETKLYDITITSVDKNADTFSYTASLPSTTFTSAGVNTGTDVITVVSTTGMTTGMPIVFSTAGTLPTGIVAGTVYYVIVASGTTIKVATTAANALAGTPIVDLTAAGAGTSTITVAYSLSDNDEIWLDGRKGELSYLWNTDYPTPQTADYIKLPSGIASDNAIVGYGKSNNRLFLFTETTTHKFDQANLNTVFDNVGCANHKTIQNIGDWLLWVDIEGKVHARNDSTGQEEVISAGIQNEYLENVPTANFKAAAAGVIDNTYKLCLGTVDGTVLRVVYDFDSNNWSRENHSRQFLQHVRSYSNGYLKLYFLDENGNYIRDEDGDLDDTVTIPLYIDFGRDNMGAEQSKIFQGCFVFGKNVSGASMKVKIEDGDPQDIGQLTGDTTKIRFDRQKAIAGRDMTYIMTINAKGDAPEIEGISTYFSIQEDKFE